MFKSTWTQLVVQLEHEFNLTQLLRWKVDRTLTFILLPLVCPLRKTNNVTSKAFDQNKNLSIKLCVLIFKYQLNTKIMCHNMIFELSIK